MFISSPTQDPIEITFLEDKINEYNSILSQEPDDDEEIISQNESEVIEDSFSEKDESEENISYGICIKCEKGRNKQSESTLYSAVWTDGPRILWDQQNQEYKRSKVQVLIKLYHENQVDEILNELKIYLDCHSQDYGLLIQFYGISKQPENNEYLIIKQYAQNGSLYDYIVDNFDNIDWEIKLHLLYYLAEDLKALHNAGYVHRNFHPFNVLVFDNSLCAIEFLTTNKIQKPTITKETKELKDIVLPNKKNLEPSEFIDFIVRNHFVKFINLSELSIVAKPIESDSTKEPESHDSLQIGSEDIT
ncbi:14228_t:CDS:2 [Rhizophagus irregularis]|nr:14228_t:CDS:2 [Rhizophagus irregularis]